MEELLIGFRNKKVDISCGSTAVYRGVVLDISNGVAHMRDDDDRLFYIAVDKVSAVSECLDSTHRPGFIL